MTQEAEDRVGVVNLGGWTLAGPASVLVSVFLLVISESPFYIDLSAVAIIGFALSFQWKLRGFLAASFTLVSVLLYDAYVERESMTFWHLGVAATIEIAFLITSLTVIDLGERWKRSIEAALEKMTLALPQVVVPAATGKEEAEAAIEAAREKLVKSGDQLKVWIEKAERFERLLSMARNELVSQMKVREEADQRSAELRIVSSILQEKLRNGEEQIQSLLDQLGGLAGRLKTLQEEKEELEKAMEEALKVKPQDQVQEESDREEIAELKRTFHQHQQLKEQFHEKSKEVDTARRERFALQEELLSLKKMKEEKALKAVFQEKYEKHILTLNRHIEELEGELKFYEEAQRLSLLDINSKFKV